MIHGLSRTLDVMHQVTFIRPSPFWEWYGMMTSMVTTQQRVIQSSSIYAVGTL